MADIVQLQSPAQALSQVGGAVNAINQNRLFQGRIAAGQALQQATDPNTGQVDPLKFNKLLAMNPDAASAMQEAGEQSQVMQGQQQNLQTNRAGAMNSALSSVLALPDDQLHAGTNAALQRLVVQQIVPPFQAAAMSQRLDSIPDPGALRSQLKQVQLGLMSPEQRQAQIYGTSDTVNDGGQDIPGVRQSPMNGGGRNIAPGAIPLTVSPDAAARPETRLDSSGNPITAPAGTFMPPSMQPAGMRNSGPNPMGNGRYSPAQAAQPAASSGLSPAPASAPPPVPSQTPPTQVSQAVPGAGGAPSVGPNPFQMEARKMDQDAFNTAQQSVAGHEQNVQTLQKAKTQLSSATTGTGAGGLQSLLSVINTFNPDAAKRLGSALGSDPAAYDEANKLLTDYARNSGAATHSDAQLSAAQTSNPSVHIAQQAAQDIASLQIGRERQAIAQVKLAPDQQTGQGFRSHSSSFASSTDPRGFAWDTYSPEQRQSILKSVESNATAKTRLLRSIGMASDEKVGGWVQGAGAPQ